MEKPDLIFVTGSNAAGKTSLIRSHLNELSNYEIILTDIYLGKTPEVFREAVQARRNIVLETPFNDEKFRDLINLAKQAGYQSSLVVLFLKSPAQSVQRVALRTALEFAPYIPPDNVERNFDDGVNNVARYFFYFDESHFYYTGQRGNNHLIMRYEKMKLAEYVKNDLPYVRHFAHLALQKDCLAKEDFDIIIANKDFHLGIRPPHTGKGHKLH